MKLLPLLGWLALAATSIAAEKEIRLRDLKPDSASFKEVQQRIAIMSRRSTVTIEILQHIEGNLYLANFGYVRNYAVEMPTKDRLADGHRVEMWVEDTGKTFGYTSVLGASVTVKRYRASEEPGGEYSTDRLIARVKGGEVIRYEWGSTKERCKVCGGLGTVRSPRVGQNRLDCNKCDNGQATVMQVWVVKW